MLKEGKKINEEFESQITVFEQDNNKDKELIVNALKRINKLRQIRIEESKILETKNSLWDGVWLYNSLMLIIISLFVLILPTKNIVESIKFETINLYVMCLTIIILVMTYYIKSKNFEKQAIIKHHEQSFYRNLITQAVNEKILSRLSNKIIYSNIMAKRNTITQFNDNHSKLAYLIVDNKFNPSNETKHKIKQEYKNEYRELLIFLNFSSIFNCLFLVIQIPISIINKNWSTDMNSWLTILIYALMLIINFGYWINLRFKKLKHNKEYNGNNYKK